mmetsp:Transcript_60414/g.169342  ORF Transcript_60414/g.169342 Transcript_60414/m.169342 type:complete len:142 (-) Transcript_60414:1381-1806(-)
MIFQNLSLPKDLLAEAPTVEATGVNSATEAAVEEVEVEEAGNEALQLLAVVLPKIRTINPSEAVLLLLEAVADNGLEDFRHRHPNLKIVVAVVAVGIVVGEAVALHSLMVPWSHLQSRALAGDRKRVRLSLTLQKSRLREF